LYWLEYNEQVLQKESHHFLENDEDNLLNVQSELKFLYEPQVGQLYFAVQNQHVVHLNSFSRVLTVNFDPLLIHACYMVGMYPFPAIYDLGANYNQQQPKF
jgi:hypothetical protein